MRGFLEELAAQLRVKSLSAPAAAAGAYPQAGQAGSDPAAWASPLFADRVVMTAAKIVLEPVFEADFLASSFGFRPKRSPHMAIEAIRGEANRGGDWVLDADIKACFDEIDHDVLMAESPAGDRSSDVEAAAVLAASGDLRGRGDHRDRRRHPAGLADLSAAGEYRAAPPRSGVAGTTVNWRDAGPLRRRLSRRLFRPAEQAEEANSGQRWCWPGSGCV